MRTKFKAHGDYSLVIEHNILIIKASGAWNKEASVEFSDKVKGLIAQHFTDTEFYCLTLGEHWFPTHDSLDVLKQLSLWLMSKGLRADAFCVASHMAAEILKDRIFTEETETYQYKRFDNENDARQWLQFLQLKPSSSG